MKTVNPYAYPKQFDNVYIRGSWHATNQWLAYKKINIKHVACITEKIQRSNTSFTNRFHSMKKEERKIRQIHAKPNSFYTNPNNNSVTQMTETEQHNEKEKLLFAVSIQYFLPYRKWRPQFSEKLTSDSRRGGGGRKRKKELGGVENDSLRALSLAAEQVRESDFTEGV